MAEKRPHLNPAHRPLLFKTPEELAERCEEYFAKETGWQLAGPEGSQVMKWRPATVSGLALFLDTSRKTLCNYRDRQDFFHVLAGARARCERDLEEGALSGTLNAQFAKHVSQNNFDWVDKQEVDSRVKHAGSLDLTVLDDETLRRIGAGQPVDLTKSETD